MLRKNNITSLLFFCTLLFLPFQFGKHFWPSFTYVVGQRVDYLSPTIYLSDICIFLLFLFSIKRFPRQIGIWLYAILIFLSINIFFSQSPFNGWYALFKLCELTFFGWYVATQTKNVQRTLFWTFALNVFLEGILGILEFIHQGSINGLWYFFGERNFTASTPGIANATIHGQLVLRPYATFPHPNVFAGYILIALLFFASTIFFTKTKLHRFVSLAFLLFGTLILLLTLSRIALAVWLVLFFVGVLLRFGKRMGVLTGIFLIVLTSGLLLLPFFSGRFLDPVAYRQSFDLRFLLEQAAFHMVISHPFFGVGLNNFLPTLPLFLKGRVLFGFLQPVHNIFLLVLAETGIVGFTFFLLLFCMAFINSIVKIKTKFSSFSFFVFLSLSAIVLIGFTDHYFLTLQQGQLLLALILGLAFFHDTIKLWPFIKSLLRIQSIR